MIPVLLLPFISLFHAVCFFLDGIFFPKLHSTNISKPIFIVGHGRSGTTLIHRLMTEDGEQFSAFRFYEMLLPSLLEKKFIRGLALLDSKFLGGWIDKRIKRWEEENLFADMQDIHKTTLTSFEEDEQILIFSLAAGFWVAFFPFMQELDFYYMDKLPEKKRRRVMKFYRQCVKRQLYLNGSNKIHLSKNPTFSGRIESIIETFPDCRMVIMMRNPCETIPSLLKLLETSWTLIGWSREIMESSLAEMIEISFHTYRYPQEVLARHPEIPQVIVDYRELVEHPVNTIATVYDKLQLELSDDFRSVLEAREQRTREHETTHSYSLEEFGLEKDLILNRLGDMFDENQWPKEA